ncbi:MAG: AAA family ATPase [Pseudomonadota bacterium]
MKKLPIGIQSFADLITGQYTYIDKTQHIYRLVTEGKSYFLSRPRRFGKSLLISTLEALFLNKRHLFQGLWIDRSDWPWHEYPVIRLDMSTINNRSPEMLERALIRAVSEIGATYGVTLDGETASDYLLSLIKKLAPKDPIVVLVDEYDKPIVDQIDTPNVAKQNRDILRQFYGVLKSQDAHLKFVFLTGVTKFSKVSVFSELNNLEEIGFTQTYSDLLGYTAVEIQTFLKSWVEQLADTRGESLAQLMAEIQRWYNGYKFARQAEAVYNPFSVLLLLKHQEFMAHWFETGTPLFLMKLIKEREFDPLDLERLQVSEATFSNFNIERISLLPLLYQTGYLTVKEYKPDLDVYQLGYPNFEVAQAFSEALLKHFARGKEAQSIDSLTLLSQSFLQVQWDANEFFAHLNHLLGLIPYDLYIRQEKYYHSLFYLIFRLIGIKVVAEVHTHRGRMDIILELQDKVFIFEFKLNQTAAKAIQQIINKEYRTPYQASGKSIYLVGVNFNSQTKSVDDWEVRILTSDL